MISWSLHLPSVKGRGASISEGHRLFLSQVMNALDIKARSNMNWPMGKLVSIYCWAHTYRRHTQPKISWGKSSGVPGNGFMDADEVRRARGRTRYKTSKLAMKVLPSSVWKTCVFRTTACSQSWKETNLVRNKTGISMRTECSREMPVMFLSTSVTVSRNQPVWVRHRDADLMWEGWGIQTDAEQRRAVDS